MSINSDLPGSPLGLDGLQHLCEQLRAGGIDIPLVGIGGINKENMAEVLLAGADGAAMVSAIFDYNDVTEACVALRREAERGLQLRREREAHNFGVRK